MRFLFALLFAVALHAQSIAGDWQATLVTPRGDLHLALHIKAESTNAGPALTGTLDSLDQGTLGIPLAAVTFDADTLSFRVDAINGSYKAKLSGNELRGSWTQGLALPLNFKRGPAASTNRHPQEPVPPFPYKSEDITIENSAAHIQLAATLTVPTGTGPFPAVVLITGSGPQDRDEAILGHKPFFVLSDYLTRHGIAVLRFDDRGFGKSTGKFDTATTADFATDAEAALAFLKSRPEVNTRKLGLIGHSEGGAIAAMIAARNADIAFVVSLAGPAVPGDKIIPAQVIAGNLALGMKRETAVESGDREAAILKLVRTGKDNQTIRAKIAESLPPAQVDAALAVITSPWYRYYLQYDPGADWKKLTIPVLALSGSKDTQVPAEANMSALKKALSANKSASVQELPGLNHLFQHARTGAPTEYAGIEETMSEEVLKRIADWILLR